MNFKTGLALGLKDMIQRLRIVFVLATVLTSSLKKSLALFRSIEFDLTSDVTSFSRKTRAHQVSPAAKVISRFTWCVVPPYLTEGGDSSVCFTVLWSQLFLPCSQRCAHFSKVMQWEHVVRGAFDNQWLVHFRMLKTCMWHLLLLCPLPILTSYWEQFKKIGF